MLTKTHLKYKLRAGRVVPAFIDTNDAALVQLATQLIELFQESLGQTAAELEDAAASVGEALGSKPDLTAAFVKLLLDRCDEQPDDESTEALRWDILIAAQKLRQALATDTPEVMRETVVATLAMPLINNGEQLADKLYADLPALRQVIGFNTLSAKDLLERYNCAQVQGLLFQARSLKIMVKEASLSERRLLFRMLKFHRLMAEVEEVAAKKTLTLSLGGPLSLFEQAQTYGLRLANFFPYILQLPRWTLEAEVSVKRKNVVLKLDQKAGLASIYQRTRPYIPEELTACLSSFNNQAGDWQADVADEFVHIGQQSYCFPDLMLTDRQGQKLHIELFHRWHAGQLEGRLLALEKNAVPYFYIGISKSLQKNAKIAELLQRSRWFEQHGFTFGEFPTSKHLTGIAARSASRS